MKFKELSYSRKNNLGNYCSEEISLSVTLDENEKPSEALPKLKKFILSQLEKPSEVAPVGCTAAPTPTVGTAKPVAKAPLSVPVQTLNTQIAKAAEAAGIKEVEF